MNRQGIRVVWGVFGIICLILSGCGPTTLTQTRFVFEPYSKTEEKQTKSKITIERIGLKEIPSEFYVTLQMCNPSTGSLYSSLMETVQALPTGSMLEKFSITNDTGHIVRFNSIIIAAFDPADNQYDIISKDEIVAAKIIDRPCSNTYMIADKLKSIKFIDKNTELLPNRTTTGYIVYKPIDIKVPGSWKISFYDLPVETNSAGIPIKTINFDFRSIAKKYIDTYNQESFFAAPIKVSTKEIL